MEVCLGDLILQANQRCWPLCQETYYLGARLRAGQATAKKLPFGRMSLAELKAISVSCVTYAHSRHRR